MWNIFSEGPPTAEDKSMMQPEAMKTNAYLGGVEKMNVHDAWRVWSLLAKHILRIPCALASCHIITHGGQTD